MTPDEIRRRLSAVSNTASRSAAGMELPAYVASVTEALFAEIIDIAAEQLATKSTQTEGGCADDEWGGCNAL